MRNRMSRCFYYLIITILLNLSLCLLCSRWSYASENDKGYFLALTDIHFDPFIACHNKTPCDFINKLVKSPANEWSKIASIYDTDLPTFRKNSNYQLLRSALNAAERETNRHPIQFVLVLGDMLGHDYRRYYKRFSQDKSIVGYQNFVKKTFQFLTLQFQAAFPKLNVYMTLGNNDSYQGDYISTPNGLFFNDMANEWSKLVKQSNNADTGQVTFLQGGYYAVTLPQAKNLRLLILNTVLFSYRAKGKSVAEAADQQLVWLNRQLADAKQNHQKVLIMMHIPIGIDIYITSYLRLLRLKELWQRSYIERFEATLKRYPNQIMSILAAHLHLDWFEVLKFPGIKEEIPIIGVPSISPIFGNNPGFKIYSYFTQTLELENFVTYYYALKRSRTWSRQYDFNHTYQPDCYHCPIIKGMNLAKH